MIHVLLRLHAHVHVNSIDLFTYDKEQFKGNWSRLTYGKARHVLESERVNDSGQGISTISGSRWSVSVEGHRHTDQQWLYINNSINSPFLLEVILLKRAGPLNWFPVNGWLFISESWNTLIDSPIKTFAFNFWWSQTS